MGQKLTQDLRVAPRHTRDQREAPIQGLNLVPTQARSLRLAPRQNQNQNLRTRARVTPTPSSLTCSWRSRCRNLTTLMQWALSTTLRSRQCNSKWPRWVRWEWLRWGRWEVLWAVRWVVRCQVWQACPRPVSRSLRQTPRTSSPLTRIHLASMTSS